MLVFFQLRTAHWASFDLTNDVCLPTTRRLTISCGYSWKKRNLTRLKFSIVLWSVGEEEGRTFLKLFGNYLAQLEMEWPFSPPAAPHFGSAFEGLAQMTKRCLDLFGFMVFVTCCFVDNCCRNLNHPECQSSNSCSRRP